MKRGSIELWILVVRQLCQEMKEKTKCETLVSAYESGRNIKFSKEKYLVVTARGV